MDMMDAPFNAAFEEAFSHVFPEPGWEDVFANFSVKAVADGFAAGCNRDNSGFIYRVFPTLQANGKATYLVKRRPK